MLNRKLDNDLGPRVPLVTVKGNRQGPRLVVTGDEHLLRDVADLVWARPDLVAINGSLVMRSEANDLGLDGAQSVMRLNDTDDPQLAFERVLGRMLSLDMIPFARVAA
ncbi:MAG: hypothetical protein HKN27_09690 [Silicimonas sp.]|nr:hypothetical protein [Silicimonas sp.]